MRKFSRVLFSTLMMAAALTVGTAAMPALAEFTPGVQLKQPERDTVDNATLDFEIVNDTEFTFTELYVGHISEDTWGENILNQDLEAGESTTVLFPTDETGVYWDVKAVFLDGEVVEYRELDLATISRLRLLWDGENGGHAEFE